MRTEWMAHLCGLCLALRVDHGQLSRVATNYDGLVISVLVEAQSHRSDTGGPRWRTAGPCPLRGMRTASVAQGEGARLAAAVSLVLASAKVRDHVADGDGLLKRRPLAAAARRVAAGWDRGGARTGAELGFDTAVLTDAVDRQQEVESAVAVGMPVAGRDLGDGRSGGGVSGGGVSDDGVSDDGRPGDAGSDGGDFAEGGVRGACGALLTVTEPTETATAAAFAHTAVLAGRPANAEPLAEAGRLFGRLAHLLDAVEDLTADELTGAWNPIAATGTDLSEVRRLCDDAVHGVRLALRDVEFTEGGLAHLLLAHELKRSVGRVFGAFGTGSARVHGHEHPHPHGPAGTGEAHEPGQQPHRQSPWITRDPMGPPPRRRGLVAGCAVWTGLCCTGQVCCTSEFEDPWSGRQREGCCHKVDCDCCDCCSNCDCCGGDGGCDCCCDCACGI